MVLESACSLLRRGGRSSLLADTAAPADSSFTGCCKKKYLKEFCGGKKMLLSVLVDKLKV